MVSLLHKLLRRRYSGIFALLATIAAVLGLLLIYFHSSFHLAFSNETNISSPSFTPINLSEYFQNYTSIIGNKSSLVFLDCNIMLNLTYDYDQYVAPIARAAPAINLSVSSLEQKFALENFYTLCKYLDKQCPPPAYNLTLVNRTLNFLIYPIFQPEIQNASEMRILLQLAQLNLSDAEQYQSNPIIQNLSKYTSILSFPAVAAAIFFAKDAKVIYNFENQTPKNLSYLVENLYPVPNFLLSNVFGWPNIIPFFLPSYALPIKPCNNTIININPALSHGLISNESALGLKVINITV